MALLTCNTCGFRLTFVGGQWTCTTCNETPSNPQTDKEVESVTTLPTLDPDTSLQAVHKTGRGLHGHLYTEIDEAITSAQAARLIELDKEILRVVTRGLYG